MARRSEECKVYIGARNEQLNPSLAGSESLIGGYFESHLLGIELQRSILVADWNADNFDAAYHFVLLVEIPGIYPRKFKDAIW